MTNQDSPRRGPSPRHPSGPLAGDLLLSAVPSVLVEGEEPEQFVVLILGSDEQGSTGIVLNQPLDVPIPSAIGEWAYLISEPRALYLGGPDGVEGAICLARTHGLDESPLGFGRLFGGVGLLELDTPVELVRDTFTDLRIFIGYTNWEAGELDEEIAAGKWHLFGSRSSDIFTATPQRLWRAVMRRSSDDRAYYSTWTPRAHDN